MQEIIVFLIVGGAVWYLTRQILGTFTAKKGCGKCDGCDSAAPKAAPPQQLLQIQVKKKS